MKRKIVEINEEKCDGCRLCVDACHEGAIELIDGKAKLVRDDYCDGLGDCLPACPTGAITIVEREAAAYNEKLVQARMAQKQKDANHATAPKDVAKASSNTSASAATPSAKTNAPYAGGCPGSLARALRSKTTPEQSTTLQAPFEQNNTQKQTNMASATDTVQSELMQWPIQIKLAPVRAPYFDRANLLIAADCAAYAYGNFHADFMKNKITLIGCPKLDMEDYSQKLTAIIQENEISSVTVARMEVPCCGGIENATIAALQASGKMIPWQIVTISTRGHIISK